MGYIYSNSKEYMTRRVKKRETPKLEPIFATVQIPKISTGRVLRIMLSKKLVQELGVGKYAIVGYDKDLNRLYVEPTIKPEGALKVGIAGTTGMNYNNQLLTVTALFNFCETEFPKKGRYKAIIAPDKTYAEIYFDLPIEGIKRKA